MNEQDRRRVVLGGWEALAKLVFSAQPMIMRSYVCCGKTTH